MSRPPRYARNQDANHREIVQALQAAGAKVVALNPDGNKGIPDLLVGFRGSNHLLEVKRPKWVEEQADKRGGWKRYQRKPGKLSDDQETWHQVWPGGPVEVVQTPGQALSAIGIRVQPYVDEMEPE